MRRHFLILVTVLISLKATAQNSINSRDIGIDAFYHDAMPVAELFLRAAIQHNPNDTIANLYLAAAFLSDNKYEEAQSYSKRIMNDRLFEAEPDSIKTVYYYTRLMFSAIDLDYKVASGYATKMIEVAPGDKWAIETHASLNKEMGLFSCAIEDYTLLLSLTRDSQTAQCHYLMERGLCYQDNGMYEDAIKDFTSILDLDPLDLNAYYRRGWCHEFLHDDVSALQDYNSGIEHAEKDDGLQMLYLMRGELYERNGDKDKAKVDYEHILQIDTTINGSCRHYALCFLGKEDEALQWMESIIQAEPEDCGNYYDKCCLLTWMGRYEEALDALEECVNLGYKKIQHIKNDNDLDPLRQFERYNSILEQLNNNISQ